MARWSIPLQTLAKRASDDMDAVYRRAVIQLFYAVVLPSPVDTGRFRANWNVSFNAPDLSTSDSTDASRAVREVEKVKTLPANGVLYLTNSLEYAITLEYGHSGQAPQGMVRPALALWPSIVKKAVKG